MAANAVKNNASEADILQTLQAGAAVIQADGSYKTDSYALVAQLGMTSENYQLVQVLKPYLKKV